MSAKRKIPDRIQVGSVSLPFYPWTDKKTGRNYWRWSWKGSDGKWKYGTRADLDEAIESAREQARTIHNGTLDLSTLPPDRLALVKAFLDLDPTEADIDRLRSLKSGNCQTLAAAVKQWVTHKLAELHGEESRTLRGTRLWLEKLATHFGKRLPAAISTADLQSYIEGTTKNPKSRIEYRARVVTLWRFARVHELFDSAPAERLPSYRLPTAGSVDILSVDEASTLLQHVERRFLPWLVFSLFSGLRAEEIHPREGTDKPPMIWEWVKLDAGLIDLPATAAKVRKRRLVPITQTLRAWIVYLGKPTTGRICGRSPSREETTRLGELIGGWRRNVLRHSYGSYRAATTKDLAALAIEMGNSPSMIERHYREAVSKEDAAKYWALTPSEVFRKSKKSDLKSEG